MGSCVRGFVGGFVGSWIGSCAFGFVWVSFQKCVFPEGEEGSGFVEAVLVGYHGGLAVTVWFNSSFNVLSRFLPMVSVGGST